MFSLSCDTVVVFSSLLLSTMTILAWNVQGIMGKRSQFILHDFCTHFKPSILVLVEIQVSGFRVDMIFLKMSFDYWFRVEAIGFNDGIWVFWNNSIGLVSLLSTHPQFMHCQVDNRVVLLGIL
ncbi:hypothetical protein MANES_06G066201v8 [Manihot esculenta]|uniref:Uncharacterized protein n=1 Tax=Manihot esculenta TaxID=3983 RepID=A0ACB7HIY1_MANES|nr:hypothetical protein MANES_06G066201v8 [Manihot esculenta]